ncbi:MAG TPA: TOMM precursor leader peptide-binding protein [Terrimesophilobacter sp.]|nr:TOMM precursor leader peptide-binding protein [Terrimesophilobacter sp.]
MTLRLDPRYPLVWRSPTSLQLGVDEPRARFDHVTVAEERLLAALTVGSTATGIQVIGANSGLTKAQIAGFQTAIVPALETAQGSPAKGSPAASHTVVVSGAGPTADRLAWRLTEAGLDPRATGASPGDAVAAPALRSAAIAVVVGHYVLDPEFYGLWLRRDIPHLPIVFGDTGVRIGPLVEPGAGPCLYCLDRYRTDADPAWPAIASQLWGLRSTAETPFLASETATVAARLLANRLAGLPAPAATSITIDAATGEQSRQGHVAHPDCGCAGLTELESGRPVVSERAPRGTSRADSRRSAARSRRTTRGADVSVPA